MKNGTSKGMKRLAASAMSIVALVSCTVTDPKLVPRPEVRREAVKNQGETVGFNPQVDILFVVDNSGSMEDHQTRLIQNIQQFTSAFLQNQLLDYHIGVVSSDMEAYGRVNGGVLAGPPSFIDRTTVTADSKLGSNIRVGTDGSPYEKFFTPVIKAVTDPFLTTGANRGFYRPDAHLAVIFITDSDDQSDLAAQQFYDQLVALKQGDPAKILSYGIFIPANDSNCDREGEPLPEKIEEFMRLSSGGSFGLCDSDYGTKLAGLASNLEQRVGRMLLLSRAPDPATIVVTFGTATLPNDPVTGWTYDSVHNALIFGRDIDWNSQPRSAKIEVNFIAAEYN